MKQHKVFISYSSKNLDIANTIYNMLESRHISCWMAPRDLITGEDYGTSIEEAIRTSQIVIFVFSKFGNKSRWVQSELAIAFSEQKIIIPFKIDNVSPKGIVRMVLTKSQWVEALNESNEHYAKLLERVNVALDESTIKENSRYRILKMIENIRKWPILLCSIILLLSSKYIYKVFYLIAYYQNSWPELSSIMTLVSIIVSTSICLFLKNDGRKWNKIVLTAILIITIGIFFILGGNFNLVSLMSLIITIPAITAYYVIIRRIPSVLILFLFYITLLFGIFIDSPWTIMLCIPIILLYVYTSYLWYKKISNTILAIIITTISIYLGMNFN